jgi:hypothetical protein
MKTQVAWLGTAIIAAIAAATLAAVPSAVSAQERAAESSTLQKKHSSALKNGGGWKNLYGSAAGTQGRWTNSGRLELQYPDLARKYGSDPLYWPPRAFKGIDCDLPDAGCPSYETTK